MLAKRFISIWNILLATEEEAKQLAGSLLISKYGAEAFSPPWSSSLKRRMEVDDDEAGRSRAERAMEHANFNPPLFRRLEKKTRRKVSVGASTLLPLGLH